MRRHIFLLLAVIAALVVAHHATAQKFIPKTIQFRGDPEYSNEELMAALGLKKGVAYNFDEMQAYTQRLADFGVFSAAAFKFDGQDLIFTLAPSKDMNPIQLDNLPLTPGKELDARLHELLPLYHGKAPSQGGMAESVRAALEKLLADDGLKATVTAAGSTYLISAPPVVVGEIRVAGKSTALDAGAQGILTKLTGTPFSAEGTPSQITTYLGNYYHDKGYVEAAVEATRPSPAVATPDAILVPFEVTATPGLQYRLAAVQLSPDLLVLQADFDRVARTHPGDIAAGQLLTRDWEFIAMQYHNHGFMKPSVHPTPTFDRTQGTVTYTVTAEPGPEYKMGKLSIENVSGDLRTLMLSAWRMPAGAVFDESAVSRFFALDDTDSRLSRVFAAVNCRYSLTLNDDSKTVDVDLRLEKRQ